MLQPYLSSPGNEKIENCLFKFIFSHIIHINVHMNWRMSTGTKFSSVFRMILPRLLIRISVPFVNGDRSPNQFQFKSLLYCSDLVL